MRSEFSKFKGKRVLVTRPKHQAAETIKKLKKAGAKVIHIPMIEIADPSDNFKSLDRAMAKLDAYDWIIFTSRNAVAMFFNRLKRFCRASCVVRHARNKNATQYAIRTTKFAAVGPATTAALKQYGIHKIIIPRKGSYCAEGLVDALKRYKFKRKRVLFPCAKKAKETLPDWLVKQGATLHKVQAYQTVMPKNINRAGLKKLIKENRIDEVYYCSKSAEENFAKIIR